MVVQYGNATSLPLEGETVHCVVTSPPYNCGIKYDGYDDKIQWPDYDEMAVIAALEMYRVLVPGGRVWVNIMPAVPILENDRGQRFPLEALWTNALLAAGLHYRDTVVWAQSGHDGGCAWGSWRRPSAPNLRGSHEVILLFFKDRWKRTPPDEHRTYMDEEGQAEKGVPGTPWTDLTRNVWSFQSARGKDHPAKFPPELPERAIRLSTWPGETVLDPFAGSGTTVDAAEALGRIGIGYDLDAPRPEEPCPAT